MGPVLRAGTTPTTPATPGGVVLTADDRISLPGRTTQRATRPELTGVPEAPGLVRARLNRHFDRFLQARIGAVIAPAGVGKTTALAHWARTSPADIAWWRATSRDCDRMAQSIRGLAGAIHFLAPSRPRATCRDSLIDRMAEYDGTPVIVIDDFHHVDDPEVCDLIEDMLQATAVRFVVVSRSEPSLNLARSEFPSAVVGIDALRFRQPETDDLFRSVHGEPLTNDDGWLLTRQTDGLAAAMHMFHQATRGSGDHARRHALQDLSGGATFAMGYVAREILSGLDAADVRLLRQTSPLELLTVERCSDLVGADCAAWLQRLVRQGLVRGLPGGYALARVVRRQLLGELCDEIGADDFGARVRACAERMVADGEFASAVRTYVAAGEWDAAAAVLEANTLEVLSDPDVDWVDAACVKGPWRKVTRAVRELRTGRLEAAQAELGPWVSNASPALSGADEWMRRALRMWIEGDLTPGRPWFERLRSTVHRPDPLRYSGGADGHQDLEHRLLHAVDCAVAGDLVSARRLAEVAPSEHPVALALCALTALLSGPGGVERLVDEAERGGVPWVSRLAGGIADPAGLPRRRDDADAMGDRWGALVLAGLHAVLSARAGNPSVAEFDDLVRRCRLLGAPALEAWARGGLALAGAWTGSPDASREAELAVGFAHTAQVPGALALAWGVLGTIRQDSNLLTDAGAEADRIGLDCRPWEWMLKSTDRRPEVVVTERLAPVSVRCFGGFGILVNGAQPTFDGVRPRARALLRVLALHAGTSVHREMLVDAMWPQLDSSAGTHNLHVCVSSLRAALEPGVARGASHLVVRDGDRYSLALPPGSVADLREFDLRTREADEWRARGDVEQAATALDLALQIYAGDVLPEDGPSEWAVGVRDRYRVRAAQAAALLGELRLAEGRPAEAAVAAQRSIEIEPCRDASWRLLVKAYDAAQDVAAAERARRSYASVLASLGVVESTADLLRGGRTS
ncbi:MULTISPECIES: BTAD domain-containing putative transcriptional regulator [unclassified Nocardioides]|uniref:BTAD domain-containing putative transcriptional regulator n=1 Tax=unclassified Nocardioides TaxID=2615069 RepID=UPI000A7624A0|nr:MULTISPECIES: BTAD domain-containing putative transcriptional regulator [unclassified Nocardioides]